MAKNFSKDSCSFGKILVENIICYINRPLFGTVLVTLTMVIVFGAAAPGSLI